MVLQKDTSIESFSIGNEVIKGTIDNNKVGKMFQLLSNLYSDKESIVLQEVTANAQDSYKRLKKEGVVTIKFDSTDRSLHIIDKAEGISPYVFKEYITKLGSSSKETETDSAGMLGIGFFSGWCVTNCIYLVTVHNGVKYTYSCTKRDYEEPDFNLLLNEITEEENGTDYWFYLPQSAYSWKDTEKEKFEKALNKLRYFENVIVEGLNFNNDYQIIQGKTFVYNPFREKNSYTELEICFGNTPYPINWEKIDVPKITVPLALKFELNEPLMILPSREALGWNNNTIEAVKNKIIDFVQEITEIYTEQTQPFDNILDYLEAVNSKSFIKIADYKVDISDLKLKSNITYSKIAHLDLIVPSVNKIFTQYTKHWDKSYTTKRSYKAYPNFWDKKSFYYSNDGIQKNKTSQIYFDCILKHNIDEINFEDFKEFFPQKLGTIQKVYPNDASQQIEEFYRYVKEDIEARYKNYDAIIPAKRKSTYKKRDSSIYLAMVNGDSKKKEYDIQYFIKPKYLFLTDSKEEYNTIYRYTQSFLKKTKDGKCNIIDVIFCAKKYHKLFDDCNIITLDEWFKSSMFINSYRRHKQREIYDNYVNIWFLEHLKKYNKNLYLIYQKGSRSYNHIITNKGDVLQIPYVKNKELIKQYDLYTNIESNKIYRKDRIIQLLRTKLKNKIC